MPQLDAEAEGGRVALLVDQLLGQQQVVVKNLEANYRRVNDISGATIMGGMIFGLSRKAATEFSFFLAIPTMFAATFYDVYKHYDLFSAADLPMFAVGFVVSFLAAWVCVRWLLRYVSTHTFIPFAWYRIAFGLVVLATWVTGMVHWAD